MKRDEEGRRLFATKSAALEAQERQAHNQGSHSGVVKAGELGWRLVYDTTARLWLLLKAEGDLELFNEEAA